MTVETQTEVVGDPFGPQSVTVWCCSVTVTLGSPGQVGTIVVKASPSTVPESISAVAMTDRVGMMKLKRVTVNVHKKNGRLRSKLVV